MTESKTTKLERLVELKRMANCHTDTASMAHEILRRLIELLIEEENAKI